MENVDGGSVGWYGAGLFDLFKYGVTKAVDAEFAEDFKPDQTMPLATNAAGQVYTQGSLAFGLPAGIAPLVLIGGALLVLLIIFKA